MFWSRTSFEFCGVRLLLLLGLVAGESCPRKTLNAGNEAQIKPIPTSTTLYIVYMSIFGHKEEMGAKGRFTLEG